MRTAGIRLHNKAGILKAGIFSGFILFSIYIAPVNNLRACSMVEKEIRTLPAEVIKDKIRGGLLGQIIGNLNGIPHENRYINEPGNVRNYMPWLPDGAVTDDDTDLEWVYICEMQKTRNPVLSAEYITELWKDRINTRIWCSNRFVRYLMDIGFKPPYTGCSIFNPWAGFNISGQFLSETFGLTAPGMPLTASRIALNYTTVAVNNEPAQATQLFTTMIATAFIENDIDKILEAGIASLDENSILVQIINDVKNWYTKYPESWEQTRQLLRDKYTQEGGGTRDRNGHELNTGAVITALLYGKSDFAETLKLAFNMGWDADCNAATAGTIIGVISGYRKMLNRNDRYNPEWQIVDRYKNTTRDNMPMNETITGFADRLVELFEMVNEKNGGSITEDNNVVVYKIPIEQPAPVTGLKTIEEQKEQMKDEFEKQIIEDLAKGNREERARAAYMAICLEMNSDLAKKLPERWKDASSCLSGYWKIMNNIFFGDFQDLEYFRKKFEKAGFKAPINRYGDNELFNDRIVWKDPEK